MRLRPLHAPPVAIEPMSREVSDIFIRLSIAERDRAPVTAEDLPQVLGEEAVRMFQVAMMCGRLKHAALSTPNLRFTAEVVLLAIYLSRNPGHIVIWAYELVWLARERPCDLWALSCAFPNGFPTPEAMTAYWDAQKSADDPVGGNRLDLAATWLPA